MDNALRKKPDEVSTPSQLSVLELVSAETYWISLSQSQCFESDLKSLSSKNEVPSNSILLSHSLIHEVFSESVEARERESKLAYSMMHPIILDDKHPLTKLIIRTEHHRLMHAGPALLASSLNRRCHITGGRRVICSITRACIILCRRTSQKPSPQLMGQLRIERVTPDIVFENVRVDYAGPIYIKYSHVRKPTVVKSYICVLVSLSVKAVHLELVLDLISEAFISTFR